VHAECQRSAVCIRKRDNLGQLLIARKFAYAIAFFDPSIRDGRLAFDWKEGKGAFKLQLARFPRFALYNIVKVGDRYGRLGHGKYAISLRCNLIAI